MPAPSISSLFSIGIDIIKTTVDAVTRTVLAQTGSVTDSTTESDRVEWWQLVGLISRPPKPQAGVAAAQGVIIRSGANDVCIASRDLRGQSLAGSISDGETCLYAAGETGTAQARILLKGAGIATIYTTTDNTSSGQSIALQVGPTGISWGTPWGALSMDSSGLTIAMSGGAGMKLGTDGTVTIIGTKAALNAGSVSLGATASPATPVVWGPAGISGVGSTSVFVSI